MITFPNSTPSPLTVSQLTLAIKNTLDRTFTHLEVRGEIVNLKLQSSGHCYFNLKDATSQISCVIFHRQYSSLYQTPNPGDAVTVHGNLSIYAPRGTYQIIVNKLEFSGSGSLLLQLHQLKMKLQNLGWFDDLQKQPIPINPKTIGIITSPTGAVIQDILHILSQKLRGFHVIINPVPVQGEAAATHIAAAIRDFNQLHITDLLIIARGGGSLEDLWPFSEECVATAIHESEIPIISAIGHETDYSISDFVADLRCSTPSTAASNIANSILGQEQQYAVIQQKIDQSISQKLQLLFMSLSSMQKHSLFQNTYLLLSLPLQKFDSILQSSNLAMASIIEKKRFQLQVCQEKLERLNPRHLLQIHQIRLQNYHSQIDKSIAVYLRQRMGNIETASYQLETLNPKAILKRGYCIPFAENSSSIIIGLQNLRPLDKLQLLFHDGVITTSIIQIKEQNL